MHIISKNNEILNKVNYYVYHKASKRPKIIDYKFLDPEEFLKAYDYEITKENIDCVNEVVSNILKVKQREENDRNYQIANRCLEVPRKNREYHPRCTGDHVLRLWHIHYSLAMPEIKKGMIVYPENFSWSIDLDTIGEKSKKYKTLLEFGAAFEVVEAPYWANITDWSDPYEQIICERFATLRSLKTGKTYRFLADELSLEPNDSVFPKENTDPKTIWWAMFNPKFFHH